MLDAGTSIVGDIDFPGMVGADLVSASSSGSASVGVVDGTASGASGVGVRGAGHRGVRGVATTPTGSGVYGEGPALGYGVQGYNSGSLGIAVLGLAEGPSGPTSGVSGQTTSPQGRGVHGFSAFASGTTYGVRGEVLSPSGYGVFSVGNMGGTGAKFFVQPHPSDPSLELRFIALEGNESGTYFRGTAQLDDGVAVVEVPEEFRLVTLEQGLTVQLTAVGAPALLWTEARDLDRIVIRGSLDVEVDYQVHGVRRGFGDHESIRANSAFVPQYRGVPYGAQYPPELRRVLVENGTLNADFTPNEATAKRLGWMLEEPERAAWYRALVGEEQP